MTTLKEEEPYAAAVEDMFISHTCSKCFACNSVGEEKVKLSRCSGCHVLFYCDAKCQKGDWKDHKAECKRLRSANFVPSMTARLIMRMIVKSKKEPDFKAYNGRTYDSLMTHSSERRENHFCVAEDKAMYAEICRFMGSKAPDFETVFLANSKKQINSFRIYDATYKYLVRGTGIYLGLSVLDHSCCPDTFVVNQGSKIMLRTTNKDLVYSDKLTHNYYDGDFFLETEMRRSQLFAIYFFYCKCEACEDIESNKKKTSGRPVCCPDSWFSITDGICNNCKKRVLSAHIVLSKVSMDALKNGVLISAGRAQEPVGYPMELITEWISNFNYYRKYLTDENMYLVCAAVVIYIYVPMISVDLACAFGDLCVQQARKSPHSLHSASILARRVAYYEMEKKTPQEMKEALNEAIDSAQVVFGPEHEITQSLLEKKMHYDFENLKTR